ncbi:unnamed protein product [Cylindrotheca closterium]|uniref:DUF6824 domain-containing protein n=1 Tax=Cylindrotheca closterium TaxID=2856 RepID=A0AAD2G0F5_9STRA|nr:unnamed protein product [Cylindrotheca closterium]
MMTMMRTPSGLMVNHQRNVLALSDRQVKREEERVATSSPAFRTSAVESLRTTRDSSNIPGLSAADVLCGRDKISHAHIGNKRFRQIIEKNREEYQTAASRDAKTNITCRIVAMIRESGGRFLKQNETTNQWEDVGDGYAREKVSHALRSAKDPNRPRPKKPRKVTKHVPTPDEDAQFATVLGDQRKIFEQLLRKQNQGTESQEVANFPANFFEL